MGPLQRSVLVLSVLLLLLPRPTTIGVPGTPTVAAATLSPIQRENAKPGTSEWKLTNAAYDPAPLKATRR